MVIKNNNAIPLFFFFFKEGATKREDRNKRELPEKSCLDFSFSFHCRKKKEKAFYNYLFSPCGIGDSS